MRPRWRSVTLVPHGSDLFATPSEPACSVPPQPSLLPNSPGPYHEASARRYTFRRPTTRVSPLFRRTRARVLWAPAIRLRRTNLPVRLVRSRSSVTQRPRRWICRRAVIGAAARPLTVTRLPLWMFKRFALTPTCASAAAGMTAAAVVAVRHSAPARRARSSVDRDIDPPVFQRPARSAYRASQRSPRARPPGSAWPSRDPPPASTSCTRGSA